jgi:hypothetical protein
MSLTSKQVDLLIKFRRAKKPLTLKVMFAGALKKAGSLSEQADIILAHGEREEELIKKGVLWG